MQGPSSNTSLSDHLGHLSPSQSADLATFKKNLEAAKLYGPPTPERPASHDDTTLLRFLRARRFDPPKAQAQFTATEQWRKENNVTQLYATFPTEEFERAKLFYPRWTGRRDKQGVPVYVYRLATLTGDMIKELNKTPVERRYQRIVALWEFMSNFTLPLCSVLPHSDVPRTPVIGPPASAPGPPSPVSSVAPTIPSQTSGAPISSVTSIIDLANVSLGTMWTLRNHLQQASELATAHYPETLNTIAVVNAPAFFGTVWGWIKAWFDPHTRDKVHVLGTTPGPQLLKLIDARNLPRTYGGELNFEYQDEPVLDDAAREALDQDSVPRGPVTFKDGKWHRPEGYVGEEGKAP